MQFNNLKYRRKEIETVRIHGSKQRYSSGTKDSEVFKVQKFSKVEMVRKTFSDTKSKPIKVSESEGESGILSYVNTFPLPFMTN